MFPHINAFFIRTGGIEPPTYGLSDHRSNRLSYVREVMVGFEPTVTDLQSAVLPDLTT